MEKMDNKEDIYLKAKLEKFVDGVDVENNRRREGEEKSRINPKSFNLSNQVNESTSS